MKLEFKPTALEKISIDTNRIDNIMGFEQGDDLIYINVKDLPRFIHELQIIANEREQQKAVI